MFLYPLQRMPRWDTHWGHRWWSKHASSHVFARRHSYQTMLTKYSMNPM